MPEDGYLVPIGGIGRNLVDGYIVSFWNTIRFTRPPPMGSLPMRINRITENLHFIQNEITAIAGEDLFPADPQQLLEIHDLHALHKVKRTVDELRQVLRTCLEFAHAQVDGPESCAVRNARVERATMMVQFACQGLQLRERDGHEVPASLFEQLTQMAIATVDRHWHVEEPVSTRAAD